MTNQEKLQLTTALMNKAAEEKMNVPAAALLGSVPGIGSGLSGLYAGIKKEDAGAGLDNGVANAINGVGTSIGGGAMGALGMLGSKNRIGKIGAGLLGGAVLGGGLSSGSMAAAHNREMDSKTILQKLLNKILG